MTNKQQRALNALSDIRDYVKETADADDYNMLVENFNLVARGLGGCDRWAVELPITEPQPVTVNDVISEQLALAHELGECDEQCPQCGTEEN